MIGLHYRYNLGFLVMTLLGGSVLCWFTLHHGDAAGGGDAGPPRIVFNPSILDAVNPTLLPGQERKLDFRIRNTFPDRVAVQEMRFSCPCASLSPANASQFPIVLAAGEEIPVQIVVKQPVNGPAGRLRLAIAAVGGPEYKILGRGLALVDLGRYLNAEPELVVLGSLKRDGGPRTAKVDIWCPRGTDPPKSYKAESSDPAITVRAQSCNKRRSDRVYFCEMGISVEPRIANARTSARVVLKTDKGDVIVPVLGFVEE